MTEITSRISFNLKASGLMQNNLSYQMVDEKRNNLFLVHDFERQVIGFAEIPEQIDGLYKNLSFGIDFLDC